VVETRVVDVAFGRCERARLLRRLADPFETSRLTLQAFEPEADYVGAVAISGKPARVRHLTWHWGDRDAPTALDGLGVSRRRAEEGLGGLRVDG
jgi:hypothetical protein